MRTQLPRLGTRKLLHKIAPRLRVQDMACGRDALFTFLGQRGLLMPKKRSYIKTTDSHHRFHCHPNGVKNTPKPSAPNQRWVSDPTYLPIRQGTVYLSLVTDAFSWRIVGHHVHASCLAALERAVREAGAAATGCVHHSDRGSQYVSDAYQSDLSKAQLRCSMTDGYDCYQNALPKRVNGILKDKFLLMFPDELVQARLLVDQAVYLYNEERPHLTLNYLITNQVNQKGKSPARIFRRGSCIIPVNK